MAVMRYLARVGFDVQALSEEEQEEVKLVDGAVLPRSFRMGPAAQVEQEFAGTVEQLAHDAQVMHGYCPGDVVSG